MLKRNSIPTQSEIKSNLGDGLANVVFELSHVKMNKYLGLLPPLVGPGKELWISPSDQLMGQNYLKPPIHTDYIKACSHNSILQIGELALEKYYQETEARIKAKLSKDFDEEKNLREAEKRRAVELVLKKTRERYGNKIQELKSRFREKLKAALEETMSDCKVKMEEAILEERSNITREMLKIVRDKVGFVITSLYRDFEFKLLAEKQNMIMEFNIIMRRDRLKTDSIMREMIRQKEEEFRIKFHELELQKIVDITYILCSERMRCSAEKHEIHQTFEKQIEAIQMMLLEANQVIKLMRDKPCLCENEKKWKDRIVEIVKQFQKFINFAFGAVPGQAEFLLSLESLLTFELDKKISEKDVRHDVEKYGVIRVVEIVDKFGRKWKPVQLYSDIHEPCSIIEDELIKKNRYKNVSNALNLSLRSLSSTSFCHFQNTFFERADFHSGDVENERKTMTELAEDSRFVVELESTKTSNLQLEEKQQKETQSFEDNEKPIKSELSILEKIKMHNKIVKSLTQINENGKKTFKIVGENGVELDQTFEEFTISRIQSLKRIFKIHPSLQNILKPYISKASY